MSERVYEAGRLKVVVELVQAEHEEILSNYAGVEQKAWNLLGVGSSTFVIVAVLQALLAGQDGVSDAFWFGLCFVVALYGAMAYCALRAVKPKLVSLTPGLPQDGDIEAWGEKYLETDEAAYYSQLLVNLIGNGTEPGTIEQNNAMAARKAIWLNYAAWLLVISLMGLVILAIVAVAA